MEVVDILIKFNCPILDRLDRYQERYELYKDHFLELLMWFIALSLEFEWKIINDEIPNFNGWWDKNLNIGLGYGLY